MTATKRAGVVGAGLMGSEIALVFALAQYDVRLTDKDEAKLAACAQRLRAVIEKGVARGFYERGPAEAAFGRLSMSTDLRQFDDLDIVTEAVFEDAAVKNAVLAELDRVCRPECILATNTSTIPISTLAASVSVARRQRFIGTHYFSPVSRMKLVEVIPGFDTSADTLERTLAICSAIGKTAIPVKDVAGFAVNRVLHAFLIEAVRLVEEGVASVEDIDTACRLGLGHPIGPFELMDVTTSQLCLSAQEIMFEAYGERFRPRPLLKQRVRAGLVGGKGRPGWRKS